MNNDKSLSEDGLINVAMAAALLGVSKKQLRTLDKPDRVPSFRTPGGHRRYRKSDVAKIIKNGSFIRNEWDEQSTMLTAEDIQQIRDRFLHEADNLPCGRSVYFDGSFEYDLTKWKFKVEGTNLIVEKQGNP